MKISNKYDVPSVAYKGVNYFPQDKSQTVKINGVDKKSIEGIAYIRGKLRQDTFYINPELFEKLKTKLEKEK